MCRNCITTIQDIANDLEAEARQLADEAQRLHIRRNRKQAFDRQLWANQVRTNSLLFSAIANLMATIMNRTGNGNGDSPEHPLASLN